MKWFKWQLLLVLAPAWLQAQALRALPSAAAEGQSGSFPIVLETANGKALVALQMNLNVPPAVTISKDDIKAGAAATASNKVVACAVAAGGSAGMTRYTCLLAGGRQTIPGGPLLMVAYKAEKKVGGAPIRVGIEKIFGVLEDGRQVTLPDFGAIIQIR